MSEHDNFPDTSTGAGRPAGIPNGGAGPEWTPPRGTALPAQRPEPNAEQPPLGAPASETPAATTDPAGGGPAPYG
ncbi:MAG: hypothetical protein ACYC0E_09575, partial [Acidimicrobiales bacterium]